MKGHRWRELQPLLHHSCPGGGAGMAAAAGGWGGRGMGKQAGEQLTLRASRDAQGRWGVGGSGELGGDAAHNNK